MPFEPWHLDWLTVQTAQQPLWEGLTMAYGLSLQHAGPCYSAFAGDRVLACAGVMEMWRGRAQVWSILSEDVPRYRKTIHKAVWSFLRGYRMRRLECLVDPRSDAAIRWAEHLGFQREALVKAYTPHGDDQILMVRLETPWP